MLIIAVVSFEVYLSIFHIQKTDSNCLSCLQSESKHGLVSTSNLTVLSSWVLWHKVKLLKTMLRTLYYCTAIDFTRYRTIYNWRLNLQCWASMHWGCGEPVRPYIGKIIFFSQHTVHCGTTVYEGYPLHAQGTLPMNRKVPNCSWCKQVLIVPTRQR